MSETEHPFSADDVDDVAAEHGVDQGELDETLRRVEDALQRTDETYEYSSEHNYGWHDDRAYYLYGDGIWETLRDELDLPDGLATAARALHRRYMLESAAERDEYDTVADAFTEGSEPLVVTNTGGEPQFGSGLSV